MNLIIDHENIAKAKQALAGLRASDDKPVLGQIGREIHQAVKGDCCRRTKATYVGNFEIVEVINGKEQIRCKNIMACPCCKQMFVDDNKKRVTGNLEDYLDNLIRKHPQVKLFIQNETFVFSSQRPLAVAS